LMASVLVAPSIAIAGPYVGVGIGGTRTESSLAELNLVPNLTSDTDVIGTDPNFASNDVSFEFTVGWMFNKHFGVEVGYTDFGKAVENYELPEACNTFGCQSREWTAQMKMTGVQAFVIGSTPIGASLDAYLKLGAIVWDADYSGFERNVAEVPGFPIGTRNDTVNYTDSGTDLAAAMGLNLKTDSPISVRAELTYYDVDTTSLVWIAQLMAIYTF
jgi:hypothetical protein